MIKFILLTLLTIILASCGDPDCIDANDFGEPKFMLSAKGQAIEAKLDDNSEFNFLEVTKSTPTGYVLNGEQLRINVNGAWSPWSEDILKDYRYSCHQDTIEIGESKSIAEYKHLVKSRVCNETYGFVESSAGEYIGHKFEQVKACSDHSFQNNICWFPYGWGVMIGFSKDIHSENEILIHMGPKVVTQDNKKVFIMNKEELQQIKTSLNLSDWSSIKLYLRVHDNSYNDNINGCIKKDIGGTYPKLNPEHGDVYKCGKGLQFTFVNGILKDDPGFLETAAQVFLNPSEELITSFYNAFINSATYKNIFYICSILFVIFIPVGFFTAYLQLSLQQLLVILIRFAIISSLLSPTGWELFDKYVKTFFWEGSNNLAKLVVDTTNLSIKGEQSVAIEIGDSIDSNVLSDADNVLLMLFSSAINTKLVALILSHDFGLLIVLALYFTFYIYIFAILKLAVILIFLFIAMSILLSIAPIFLIFGLFQYTREQYFEKWLQSLISVSLQPMMLFTFFGMFLAVVNSYIYDMLYYDACWYIIVDLLIEKIGFWKVSQAYGDIDSISGIRPKIEGSPNIKLEDIFLLFLSAMVIRYIVDKVPEISEKIAGGFSLGSINDITNKTLSGVEKFGEEFAKATAGSVWTRTAGKALSSAADKLPSIISKNAHKISFGLINKTKSAQLASAKKKLSSQLKSKGWSKEDIDKAMKSGKLDKKLAKEMIKEKAKEKRYGTNTLNPLKMGFGIMREIKDNIKNSAIIAASGKMSSKQKKQLKESNLRSDIKKLNKDQKKMEKLQQKASNIVDKKVGKKDLEDIAKGIKYEEGKQGNIDDIEYNKNRINKEIKERMQEKGYAEEKIDQLINDNKNELKNIFNVDDDFFDISDDDDDSDDGYDSDDDDSDDDDSDDLYRGDSDPNRRD